MRTNDTIDLASLRFAGPRFEAHGLDVECTVELIAYRNLIVDCAKELWRRTNPGRVRLPRGFDEDFRLQFDRVQSGSTLIALQRVRMSHQTTLDLGDLDEFDEAARLVDAAINAASADSLLPEAFPYNVVPLFREFGKSLRADETLFVRSRSASADAPYTAKARERLAEWVGSVYEDEVDVIGEVRMANVGPGNFLLQLDRTDTLVGGKFDTDQEAEILDASRNHQIVRPARSGCRRILYA
jgi:hypothetical protein